MECPKANQWKNPWLPPHRSKNGGLNGLGASLNNLAGVYVLLGRPDEAEATYRRSVPIREQLASEHPAMLGYVCELGSAYCNLGELDTREGRPVEAVPWLDKAINVLEEALRREPRHATARFYLSYTRSWKARALGLQGAWQAALQEWERAIDLDDRKDPGLRGGRAAALAEVGKREEAAREVVALAEKAELDADTLYAMAEAISLCSANIDPHAAASESAREELAAQRQALAIKLLGRAAASGYFKDRKLAERAQSNPAFASVKARPDFQAIVAPVPESPSKP